MLPSSHCHPSRIRILCHHEAIPASYPGVNDNISKLFTDRSRYDVVLHLGTGIYQSDYTIEKIARRDGYQTSEQDQSLPSKHERPEYQQSSPPKLETPARIPDVVARCKGEAPVCALISPIHFTLWLRVCHLPTHLVSLLHSLMQAH